MAISHVELYTAEAIELGALQHLFPMISFVRVAQRPFAAVDGEAWSSEGFDFWAFDRLIDELDAGGAPLAIATQRDTIAIASQILTRAQRVIPRRTRETQAEWFARVLELHRRLHDVSKPLVRADLDHALDTWQWSLRLDAAAPPEVQLAALCHDLERLDSEADERVEHRAPDYQRFKDAHAAVSAMRAGALFSEAGVPRSITQLAVAEITRHEHTRGDLVADADALSFFSLNSVGYLRYFGADITAQKVVYSYNRLSTRARRELGALRMPAVIATQLAAIEKASVR
jgi:hypothetical protein